MQDTAGDWEAAVGVLGSTQIQNIIHRRADRTLYCVAQGARRGGGGAGQDGSWFFCSNGRGKGPFAEMGEMGRSTREVGVGVSSAPLLVRFRSEASRWRL